MPGRSGDPMRRVFVGDEHGHRRMPGLTHRTSQACPTRPGWSIPSPKGRRSMAEAMCSSSAGRPQPAERPCGNRRRMAQARAGHPADQMPGAPSLPANLGAARRRPGSRAFHSREGRQPFASPGKLHIVLAMDFRLCGAGNEQAFFRDTGICSRRDGRPAWGE